MMNQKKHDEFVSIFNEKIKRDGAEKLLEYLQGSTFFTDPSAKSHHGNFDGGLVEHSLNVYHCLVKFCETYKQQFPETEFDEESIAIIGLLHDLCKIGLYKKGFRNVKNDDTGQWNKKEVYEYDDKLGMGHGEGSVYIIQSFMKITRPEALSVLHHMGAWSNTVKGGDYSINVAQSQTPLVTLISIADMWASQFMEETKV
jgi:hypothetical protein